MKRAINKEVHLCHLPALNWLNALHINGNAINFPDILVLEYNVFGAERYMGERPHHIVIL